MKITRGFTLIEILLAMAIIAVLVGITVVAINPLEQIAKTNDTKTKQSVNQLGGLTTAFFAQKIAYPTPDNDWMDELIANADLGERPDSASSACNPESANDSNFCLQVSGDSAIVYARLDSQAEENKCTGDEVAYFSYLTTRGASCVVCASENATLVPTETCDAQ